MSQEEDARDNGHLEAFASSIDGNREYGMTKRELMAAVVATGVVSARLGAPLDGIPWPEQRKKVAEEAVLLADELLLALEHKIKS